MHGEEPHYFEMFKFSSENVNIDPLSLTCCRVTVLETNTLVLPRTQHLPKGHISP